MGPERSSFWASSQAPHVTDALLGAHQSEAAAPQKPASNNATGAPDRGRNRKHEKEEKQDRKSGGRNGKQAVPADSKCTSEGRQEEAPTDGMFERQGGEDERTHGGGGRQSPLPPPGLT